MGNKRQRQAVIRKNPHFIAGLGDGNVRKPPPRTGSGVGNSIIANDDFFSAKDREMTPFIRSGRTQKAFRDTARDIFHNHRFSNPSNGDDMTAAAAAANGVGAAAATEGPWQFSAMALLCLMGLLVGLFLHLVHADSSTSSEHKKKKLKQAYSIRRGGGVIHRRTAARTSQTKKKKTDEWSKDEHVDEDDNDMYKADSEAQTAGTIAATAAGAAGSATTSSSSSRYYPYHPRYHTQQQQQQHPRHRTTSTSTTATTSSCSGTLHHRVPAATAAAAATTTSNAGAYKGPSSSRHNVVSVVSGTTANATATAGNSTSLSPVAAPMLRQSRSIDSGTTSMARGTTAAATTTSSSSTTAYTTTTSITRPSIIEGMPSTSEQDKQTTLLLHGGGSSNSPWRPRPTLSPVSSFASMENHSSSRDGQQSSSSSSGGGDEELGSTPPPRGRPVHVLGLSRSFPNKAVESSSNNEDKNDNAADLLSPQRPDLPVTTSSCREDGLLSGSEHELETPRAGPRPIVVRQQQSHHDGDDNDNNNASNMSSPYVLAPPPEHEPLPPTTPLPPQPHNDGKTPLMLPFIPNLEVDDTLSTSKDGYSPQRDDTAVVHSSSMEDDRVLRHSLSEPMAPAGGGARAAAQPAVAYPGHVRGMAASPDATSPERPVAAVAASEPISNEARKNIIHKRQDITHCTDAESSLMGASIDFSEITLHSVIGGGGFGEVWRATWRSTPVAVKILTGSAQREIVAKGILEEFAAEINMLKGMRHPNICLYMGACLKPPNRAIITELASNGSLWDALRLPLSAPFVASDGTSRTAWPWSLYSDTMYSGLSYSVPPKGTWPWTLVKRVACGAARGLTYLHAGNPPVLHRDLKSANLLLDDSYTCKVCDFGLSRLKAQERSMTGGCGTVQWMAPEVLSNQRYAEPADVYSFGIILWEMLTRECPYEDMSAIQCALAVLNRDERPEIPRWCPPSFSALIRACWDKEPSKRPTFPQILLALDAMP